MLERLSKTHRNVALIAIAVLVGWFFWTVRSVLNPLILGYLLAYILRPSVQRLEDRGLKRRAAVNIIFAAFGLALLVIGGGVFVQGRQFVENQVQLIEQGRDPFTRAEKTIDDLLGSAGTWFDDTFRSDAADKIAAELAEAAGVEDVVEAGDGAGEPSGGEGGVASTDPAESTENGGAQPEDGASDGAEAAEAAEAADAAEAGAAAGQEDAEADPAASGDGPTAGPGADADASELTLRDLLGVWAESWTDGDGDATGIDKARIVLGYIQRVFGGVLSVLGFLFLLPVYTYFLLFELERIHDFVRAHVPKHERDRVTRIGRSVGQVIANFFRGRLLICFLKGLIIAVGLTVLQVPYGFLLGMVAGFMALIPFVGPFIGFALAFLVEAQHVTTEGGGIWLHLTLLAGIFTLAEVLEGYVLIPKVLGDSLGLHPVVILLSVFVGGAALGLFGFLIAIPLAATVIILFRELVMPALEEFAEEDSHVDRAPAGP